MNVIMLIGLVLSTVSDWKAIAFDRQRTGRTSAVGRIQTPRLTWQIDTSAQDVLATVTPSREDSTLELRPPKQLSSLSDEARERWGLAPSKLDVVGDGQMIVPPTAPGARWGKFLGDVPGFQRLSWTTTWGENARFQLHSFENGIDAPRLVWDVPFEGAMYSPLVIVVDIDSDGKREAVLSMWHGVVAYELTTGAEKYRSMYREGHGRQYGFFGAYIDADGRAYLVVIGDFAGHIGVLSFRDGELKALWSHLFDPQSEQGIDRRYTINTVGPNPIGDFDGDGRGEVLMNVFNETGDGRWHLLAYDLETGEHRLDLPDVYLHGHADVDGDGVDELLTQFCPHRPVGTNGELRVYQWEKKIWEHRYGRWSMMTLPELPLTRITGATRGMETPITMEGKTGHIVFMTTPNENAHLQALRFDSDGSPEIVWSINTNVDTTLDAVATSGDETLIRMRLAHDTHGHLAVHDAKAELVASQRFVRGTPHPLVLHDTGKVPRFILAESMDKISGWQIDSDGKPHRQWRLPGREMTTQVPQMLGLAAGDVDGDGRVEVLAVQENRDGSSRLVAINLDGVVRWHYDFPDFGGRAPVWNECGTTIWSVGNFFDNRRIGVLVSNRRSIMHSDETVIIDPETDKLVWHRNVLEVRQPWTDAQWSHTRGYGGGPVALADFDDDGLDEIVLCYPAEYSVVKGVTGEQLIVESTGPLKGTDGFWVFSGQPLVADLDGDGQPETLWTSPSMLIAFAHRNGRAEIIWRTEPNDGTNTLPAIGDVDADGHFEIGLPGCKDGFRCLDGATGTVQWTIPARGGSTSNCVVADIDNDGIEEFIYADGSKLLAVGRRGQVKWEFDLPVPIEYIIVADVDGDDNAEILVSGSNGVVYCVE